MVKIVPAILTESEEEYHDQLLMAEHVSDIIQIDVIDGKFAKNQTVGCDIIKKYKTSSMLEIQLMVLYPQNYIEELKLIDYVSRIIVPLETEGSIPEAIYNVRMYHKEIGLSINPATPAGSVFPFLDDIDMLVILAVEPGFSGQKFKNEVLDKVRNVKKNAPGLAVEVDGGITFENAEEVARSGADFLAVNSTLFRAADFHIAYEKLAKLVQK